MAKNWPFLRSHSGDKYQRGESPFRGTEADLGQETGRQRRLGEGEKRLVKSREGQGRLGRWWVELFEESLQRCQRVLTEAQAAPEKVSRRVHHGPEFQVTRRDRQTLRDHER